ncbi:hypothetical protein ABR737_01035 [Streptomyces sp. Edi2]|uniref:hypothetical protein n=1 Tax=Streptomyces sp. Edi2 TaxID=3162528 RepID=UPI00330581E7
MSRYTQIPQPHVPAPSTAWQWAADFDQTADDIEAGQTQPALDYSGRPFRPADHRSLAAALRVNALIGVLTIDGVPAMGEGWALSPHPVRVTQQGNSFGFGDCPAAVEFPLLSSLDEAVPAFYRALARTVRGCRFGEKNPFGSPAWTHTPCQPCSQWADQYLAELIPAS